MQLDGCLAYSIASAVWRTHPQNKCILEFNNVECERESEVAQLTLTKKCGWGCDFSSKKFLLEEHCFRCGRLRYVFKVCAMGSGSCPNVGH